MKSVYKIGGMPHLIPRRRGDVANPRGGVRHIIADKGFYEDKK